MRTKEETMRLLSQLFSNQESLDNWLDSPQAMLDYRTPRSAMEEESGLDAVFKLIDLLFNGGGGL